MRAASADDEQPVFMSVGDDTMFGVLTRPVAPSSSIGVALVWGSGPKPSFGQNQIRTRLARAFAGRGLHALRFDYPGAGECPGDVPRGDFAHPFADHVVVAVERLVAEGCDDIILVCMCFGGRNAVAALDRLPSLAALALISVPLVPASKATVRVQHMTLGDLATRGLTPGNWRRYLGRDRAKYAKAATRRLGHALSKAVRAREAPATTPAGAFLSRLRPLLEARKPVLLLSGTEDAYHPDLLAELEGGVLTRLQRRYADVLRVRILEGRVHGLGRLSIQDDVVRELDAWIQQVIDQRATRVG